MLDKSSPLFHDRVGVFETFHDFDNGASSSSHGLFACGSNLCSSEDEESSHNQNHFDKHHVSADIKDIYEGI